MPTRMENNNRILRLAKRLAASGGLQRFRVKEFGDYPDSIICRTWDGENEGESDIQVAKPWDCRREPFHGRTIDGVAYTYSSNVRRTGTKAGVTETQVLVPAYHTDCEIFAFRDPRGGTGVNIVEDGKSSDVIWQEFSCRAFAAEDESTLLGSAASGGIIIGGGVQNNVAAERDPTHDDDSRSGYAVSSVWVNIDSGACWMCVDASEGAAVWVELTGGLTAAARLRSHILVVDTPTTGDDFEPCYVPAAASMVRVVGVTDAGTVDFNIEKRSKLTPGSAGTNIWSADKQATSGGLDQTSFDSGAIAADSWLHVDLSAVSGGPTRLRIAITYELTGA